MVGPTMNGRTHGRTSPNNSCRKAHESRDWLNSRTNSPRKSAGSGTPSSAPAMAVVAVYHGTMIHGRLVHSPARTSSVFSRRTNAAAKATTYEMTKNGEKPATMPRAYAAARRGGVSSSRSTLSAQRYRVPRVASKATESVWQKNRPIDLRIGDPEPSGTIGPLLEDSMRSTM